MVNVGVPAEGEKGVVVASGLLHSMATGWGRIREARGRFQRVGQRQGDRPRKSGKTQKRAAENGRKGKCPGAPGYDL